MKLLEAFGAGRKTAWERRASSHTSRSVQAEKNTQGVMAKVTQPKAIQVLHINPKITSCLADKIKLRKGTARPYTWQRSVHSEDSSRGHVDSNRVGINGCPAKHHGMTPPNQRFILGSRFRDPAKHIQVGSHIGNPLMLIAFSQ